MSEFQQLRLLFRVHRRMIAVKLHTLFTKSRLMAAILVGFLLVYTVSAYVLLSSGLNYVAKIPGAGGLLSDRLLHVIFLCFFMMLIFSAFIAGFIALYRNKETNWLFTLPVTHRVIFLWKTLESAAFSSWGLFFISAPLIVAFAQQRDSGPVFYMQSLLVFLPFLLVSSSLAALVLLMAVRFLSKKVVIVSAGMVMVVMLGVAVSKIKTEKDRLEGTAIGSAQVFDQVMRHTDVSANPVSPSTWIAGAIVNWSRPYSGRRAFLYPALLVSNGLMGMMLVSFFGKQLFFDSWNRSVQGSAVSSAARAQALRDREEGRLRKFPRFYDFLGKILTRPLSAVTRKDILTFTREPAQWIQFVIVFSLLAIYAAGLRQMNRDLDSPRDVYVVIYLNLSVCALALSTLTTRFVFPQFSLEGRCLWVLAMSPLKLSRVVLQKFALSTVFTGMATVMILVLAGKTLDISMGDTLFFAVAVAMLAMGLNAIAVGFGVIFPNLEESNAARIVSGFGGTICLVTSFVFIATYISLLVAAQYQVFLNNQEPVPWFSESWNLWAVVGMVLITALAVVLPTIFAMRKLRNLVADGGL